MWAELLVIFCVAATTRYLPVQAAFVTLTGDGRHPSSCFARTTNSNSNDKNNDTTMTSPYPNKNIMDRSTLLLLEHINLNVPSHEYILPFYLDVLRCGLDPRKTANLQTHQTIWANCGASQFHLPHDPTTAQCIPGQIGLWYKNPSAIEALKERVRRHQMEHPPENSPQQANPGSCRSCIQQFEVGQDPSSGREYVRLVDQYNNVFYCRAKTRNDDDERQPELARDWKQPIVTRKDTETWGHEVVSGFDRDDEEETDCQGIAYVEFQCPVGTADKIALFYESVLDATTSVVNDPTSLPQQEQRIAVIAIGNIDKNGRADQSLLFRETKEVIPPYDGHHIAMYVGETAADFEQAFANAQLAGVVWVNPRFSDKTENIQGARKWKQFRFKDILDLETGEKIFELEHEMRSVKHEAFPGRATTTRQ